MSQLLFSLGLIAWQVKARRAEAVNLTAEDMALVAEDQPPQFRARLAIDEAARKDFAENLRSLFAVAEEARTKGMGNKPDIKRQLDLVSPWLSPKTTSRIRQARQVRRRCPSRKWKSFLSNLATPKNLISLLMTPKPRTRRWPLRYPKNSLSRFVVS